LDSSVVITGRVPVIPIKKSAALQSIEMAGTSPAMTREGFTSHIGQMIT
jgi:hypothetical protein